MGHVYKSAVFSECDVLSLESTMLQAREHEHAQFIRAPAAPSHQQHANTPTPHHTAPHRTTTSHHTTPHHITPHNQTTSHITEARTATERAYINRRVPRAKTKSGRREYEHMSNDARSRGSRAYAVLFVPVVEDGDALQRERE